jgi:hypothetical protein
LRRARGTGTPLIGRSLCAAMLHSTALQHRSCPGPALRRLSSVVRPGRCSLRKGDMLRGISFFSDGFHRFASHISPSEAPILSLLARREEGR